LVEKDSRGKARQQEAHHRRTLRHNAEKRDETRISRRINGISRRSSAHELGRSTDERRVEIAADCNIGRTTLVSSALSAAGAGSVAAGRHFRSVEKRATPALRVHAGVTNAFFSG